MKYRNDLMCEVGIDEETDARHIKIWSPPPFEAHMMSIDALVGTAVYTTVTIRRRIRYAEKRLPNGNKVTLAWYSLEFVEDGDE